MPEVNSARNPLPIGEKPKPKLSSSEEKLHRAGEVAKQVQDDEKAHREAKTQRLKTARLAAEASKK